MCALGCQFRAKPFTEALPVMWKNSVFPVNAFTSRSSSPRMKSQSAPGSQGRPWLMLSSCVSMRTSGIVKLSVGVLLLLHEPCLWISSVSLPTTSPRMLALASGASVATWNVLPSTAEVTIPLAISLFSSRVPSKKAKPEIEVGWAELVRVDQIRADAHDRRLP